MMPNAEMLLLSKSPTIIFVAFAEIVQFVLMIESFLHDVVTFEAMQALLLEQPFPGSI